MKLCKFLLVLLAMTTSYGSGYYRRTSSPSALRQFLNQVGFDGFVKRMARGIRISFMGPQRLIPRPPSQPFPTFNPQQIQQNFRPIQDPFYTFPSYEEPSYQNLQAPSYQDSYGAPLAPPVTFPTYSTTATAVPAYVPPQTTTTAATTTTTLPPVYVTTTTPSPVYFPSSTAVSPFIDEIPGINAIPPKLYHPVENIIPEFPPRSALPLPPRQYFPLQDYLTATMYRKVEEPSDLHLGSSDTLLVVERFPRKENGGKVIFLGPLNQTETTTESPETESVPIKFKLPDEETTTSKYIPFTQTESVAEETSTTKHLLFL